MKRTRVKAHRRKGTKGVKEHHRNSGKIPVKSITITRAEGPIALCDKPMTFKTFRQANGQLTSNSYTAPEGGAYDKHDFTVIWKDGQKYDGRYDLHHGEWGDIGGHIRNFMKYLASGKSYRDSPQVRKEAKEFLKKYKLSD